MLQIEILTDRNPTSSSYLAHDIYCVAFPGVRGIALDLTRTMLTSCILGLRRGTPRALLSHSSTILRPMSSSAFPITAKLETMLQTSLSPTVLEIRNESYKHKGPKDAESHFQVIIVSDQFEGLPLLKRHRLVHQACADLLETQTIHALSIVAKTPQQWQTITDEGQRIAGTPPCHGGGH